MGWVFWAVVTTLIYGVWAFFPKLTSRYLQPADAIVYEVLGGLIFGLLVLIAVKGRPETHGWGILFAGLTGFCLLAGGLCYLYACKQGPSGPVVSLTALYPLVTIFLARVFLGESMNWKQWIGVVLALLAARLLIQQDTPQPPGPLL